MAFELGTSPSLIVDDLKVGYAGGQLVAVEGLSLNVRDSEFIALIGPTGCGKSSILNAIAGFVPPQAGSILVNGREVVSPGPDRGFVFQDFDATLFMWSTVRGNVAFGPKVMGLPSPERHQRVTEILAQVGLGDRADSYCFELSGGMRQRVAIARCLVNRPSLLLMDEPFGSLDAQTRGIMQRLLLDLWQEYRPMVVFVTHDIDEAITLADRIFVLSARPAQVKAEITVNLDRPRASDVTVSDAFIALKRELLTLLSEEVGSSLR